MGSWALFSELETCFHALLSFRICIEHQLLLHRPAFMCDLVLFSCLSIHFIFFFSELLVFDYSVIWRISLSGSTFFVFCALYASFIWMVISFLKIGQFSSIILLKIIFYVFNMGFFLFCAHNSWIWSSHTLKEPLYFILSYIFKFIVGLKKWSVSFDLSLHLTTLFSMWAILLVRIFTEIFIWLPENLISSVICLLCFHSCLKWASCFIDL